MERYNRHIRLEAIGLQGQKRLLAAKVMVIGAGGLGALFSNTLLPQGLVRLALWTMMS